MNAHFILMLEEMMKNSKPDLQERITKVFGEYVMEEKEESISTIKCREIIKKIKPAFEDNEEVLSRINGYNMVSYDRESIVHILRTKYSSGLTLQLTSEQFGVSKNTIMNWEKKLANDPEMMKEVSAPGYFHRTFEF